VRSIAVVAIAVTARRAVARADHEAQHESAGRELDAAVDVCAKPGAEIDGSRTTGERVQADLTGRDPAKLATRIVRDPGGSALELHVQRNLVGRPRQQQARSGPAATTRHRRARALWCRS